MRKLAFLALIAALVVPAMAAPTETVDVWEQSTNPRVDMGIFMPNFAGGVTAMTGVYNFAYQNLNTALPGITNWGFCIEAQYSGSSYFPYSIVSLDSAPNPYGPGNPAGPMGASRADYIRELWAANIDKVTDATNAAAFQLAVWEIVYEAPEVAWDVKSGDILGGYGFRTNSTHAATDLANSWLGALTGNGPKANLVALTSPGYQDYVVQVVPAPGAILLAGIGTSLVGWLRRRRSM